MKGLKFRAASDGDSEKIVQPSEDEFQPASILEIDHNLIDLELVENAFSVEEGFPRPDWKKISAAIKARVPPEQHAAAWTQAATQWAERVRESLGASYQVRRSNHFLLVSEQKSSDAAELLTFAESTRDNIHSLLKDAAWKNRLGKHVIFLFTDDDDYYEYVAYFITDGVHPNSSGCLIRKGYVHIAMPFMEGRFIRSCLAHELTHNGLAHLPIPIWLNEGIAVKVQRTVEYRRAPILDSELRDRHFAFWNPNNIQKFWSGISFDEPGDSNELSYSLAEIIITLLLEKPGNFPAFVKSAHWSDAGQTAALDCLDTDLGDTMATFMAPGDWRPNRKAIAESFQDRRKKPAAATQK